MRLVYERWYRQHGIFNHNKLGRPKLSSTLAIDLPQLSMYHHVDMESPAIGMPPESEFTKNKAHTYGMLFQHNYSAVNPATMMPYGVTARHRQSLFAIENEFFKLNPVYKNLRRNMNLASEKNNLIIQDYTLLPQTVSYRENRYGNWYKFRNMFQSLIDNINALSKQSQRQHFIELNAPEMVVPLSIMNMVDQDYGKNEPDAEGVYLRQDLLKNFGSYDKLFFLDLWVWLGTFRKKSLLAGLSEIARSRTNIIIRAGANYTVINLAELDSWLMKPDVHDPKAKLPSRVAKLRLLGMFMYLSESRNTLVLTDNDEEAIVDDESDEADAAQQVDPEKSRNDLFGGLAPTLRRLDVDLDKIQDNTGPDTKLEIRAQHLTPQATTRITPDDIGNVNPADASVIEDEQLLLDMSDDEILKDLEQLEYKFMQAEIAAIEGVDYEKYEPPTTDPEEAIYQAATTLAGKVMMSEAELRRVVNKSSNYKKIENPWGGEGTFADAIQIKPEDVMISERTPLAESIMGVTDESMLSSSVARLNSQYITNMLHKDIGNAVLAVQQAGVILDDYKITHVENYNDSFDVHTIRLVPVRGQPSTIQLQIPTIRPDGTFYVGGVRYRMRTQRGDLPIRKTGPDKVVLTSYYSKMFVKRSERKVFNYASWITGKLIAIGWAEDNPDITNLSLADVSNMNYNGSRVYSAIGTRISGFVSKGFTFNFDSKKIAGLFGDTIAQNKTPVALNVSTGEWLQLTDDSQLVLHSGKNTKPLGSFESWFGLDTREAPLDVAEIKLFGKSIPLGVLLAQHTGLGSLLKTLGATYRSVAKGTQPNLQQYEYAIRFEDETLILDRRDQLTTLLMSGFNRYHQHIKQYSRYAFDKRDIYGVLFENAGIGGRKTKDIDFMFKMWVDHITRGLLEEMEMPTDLFNLFIEAAKLLMTDQYQDETDVAYMRDKGYERIAGAIYSELTNTIKAFNARPNALNSSIQIKPMEIWTQLQNDQSTTAVDESNPIQSLKDLEVVVFRGNGGRSSVSMTAPTRTFHQSAMGVTSEATVDNGDVGTISFTSADPNYTSVRGKTRCLDSLENNAAKIISTSMLLAPGADMDD